MSAATEWVPIFSAWRHGGWYIDNCHYPSGAVGCVSRNYPDRKWRIVCDPRPGSFLGGSDDHTYRSRDAAARAEYELVRALRAVSWVGWDTEEGNEGLPRDLTPGLSWGAQCTEGNADGYLCTRLRKHTGRHAAGNGERVIAVWAS